MRLASYPLLMGSDHLHGMTAQAFPVNVVDYDVQVQSVRARLNVQFFRDEYRAPLK
jgi:hypothetical protein